LTVEAATATEAERSALPEVGSSRKMMDGK